MKFWSDTDGANSFTRLTAEFVVSRCAFFKLRRDFGVFCSVNHLSGAWGRGYANHDSDETARKMTREYIKDNWKVIGIYFEGRMEGTRHCFSLESGGDIRKEDLWSGN